MQEIDNSTTHTEVPQNQSLGQHNFASLYSFLGNFISNSFIG